MGAKLKPHREPDEEPKRPRLYRRVWRAFGLAGSWLCRFEDRRYRDLDGEIREEQIREVGSFSLIVVALVAWLIWEVFR